VRRARIAAIGGLIIAAAMATSGCATRRASVATASLDRTHAVAQALDDGPARNVILMIGDGMGHTEITVARNYARGAAGRLRLDRLPLTGACTTYAVQETNPQLPDYVTDSAASATAWATGHKTSNGRLATAARTDAPLRSIVELAQARGLRTGSVTTAELTDATPAALAAHINHRSCQGPADMARCATFRKRIGGPGSIAEQTVDHHLDVLLGGGLGRFEETVDGGPYQGHTVIDSARAQGYRLLTNAAELEEAPPGEKVLGLFADGNLTLEWGGEPAKPFPGSGPQRCVEDLRPPNEPSLAAMTRKAIALLDGGPGFFLQVEGASIDKCDHVGDVCGQIGATVAFDDAVGVALDYAQARGDTLVVVTADHAHTSQIIPPPEGEDRHSPGAYSTVITADGAPMTVNYATNLPGHMQEHTGAQVRIAAYGPQAANVVGITDNTELFSIMSRARRIGK
jgi:alkaline phosphatase